MYHQQRYSAWCHQEPKENVQGSRWSCHGSHHDPEDLEKVHFIQQLPPASIPHEASNRNPSSIQALAAQKSNTEETQEAARRQNDRVERDAGGVQEALADDENRKENRNPHQFILSQSAITNVDRKVQAEGECSNFSIIVN